MHSTKKRFRILALFLCMVQCLPLQTGAEYQGTEGPIVPIHIRVLPPEMPRTLPAGISGDLLSFIRSEVVPEESIYFMPGVGIDGKSGMPYDHLRIRLDEQIAAERGNYTAASKLSLLIPYLLGVMTHKPALAEARLGPFEAEMILKTALATLIRYIKKYPDYDGFLPWVDIQPNGNIAPSNTKIPSLDNGQLSWALAAVVSALENSPSAEHKEIARMAEEILRRQNYAKFYDPEKKMLHGTIQRDAYKSGVWRGDKTYYLNDMCEGILAVLWAVLHGQVPEDAWYNLRIPTAEYTAASGEKITALLGYRASFHEQWALIFLPLMESALAPLYRNYLYIQADYASRRGMPGFLSTAYDAGGTYRQMGIPAIAAEPVERSDVSVVAANALAMLIYPELGAVWLKKIYGLEGIRTPLGAVESAAKDGYADIVTADAKGLTLLAVSGGAVEEIKNYLSAREAPGTGISMYEKLAELLDGKYLQMLEEREGEPLNFPEGPYPVPSMETAAPESRVPPGDPGPVFNISARLQPGHLHGKNVRSKGEATLEDDIRPGCILEFEFEIPAYYPYFDQWAFRGTYISPPVGISKMKYLSVDIPAGSPPMLFEIELKSDDIVLAPVLIDTLEEGVLSADRKWKTVAARLELMPEAAHKHFNYVSAVVHDPRYLQKPYAFYGREGLIALKDMRLSQSHPFSREEPAARGETRAAAREFDILRYWRLRHGAIPLGPGESEDGIFFKGGPGWKGGYLPYTKTGEYRYLYLKIRSRAVNLKDPNRVYIELKNESDLLTGSKIPLNLPRDHEARYFRIELPKDAKPLNYFALSDPLQDFELLEAFLSAGADEETFDAEIAGVRTETRSVKYPWRSAAPQKASTAP